MSSCSGARGRGERGSLQTRVMLVLIARCGPIYRLLRVDHALLLELLRTRWLLDDRRRRGGEQRSTRNIGTTLMVGFFVLFGAGVGAAAFAVEDPMIYMSMVSTMVLVMLIFPLLADFSVVLFDTSDLELLAQLPIPDRTLVAARVTTLLSYVWLLVTALGAGPLLIGFCAYLSPGYLVIVSLALLQSAALAVSLVLILYLTALKTLDLARFRDALVIVQAGSMVAFYALVQLGPPIAERLGLGPWLEAHPALLFGMPTSAGGSLLRMEQGQATASDPWLALSGLGITLLLVLFALFLARDGVVRQLAQLEASGGRALTRSRRYGLSGWLSRSTQGPLGRAGWMFFLAQSSSDRAFKMRALPGLALLLVPLFSMLLVVDKRELQSMLETLCYAPYLLMLTVSSVWNLAYFAESWEGRWVFLELAEEARAEVTRGAMQASIARYLIVPLVWALPVMFYLLELDQFLGFLFAVGLSLRAILWALPRYGPELPFTRKASSVRSAQGQNLVLSIGILLLAGSLGLVHSQLARIPHVMELAPLFSLFFAGLAWRSFEWQEFPARPRRSRRKQAAIES